VGRQLLETLDPRRLDAPPAVVRAGDAHPGVEDRARVVGEIAVDRDEERLGQGGRDRLHARGVDEILVDDRPSAGLDERADRGTQLAA
jgi:hypothetical protein